MGYLFQISLIGIYFIASRGISKAQIVFLIRSIIVVSSLTFVLGILNRYKVDPFQVMHDPVFLSTLGNINWFCGYWSVIYPLSFSLFLYFDIKSKDFVFTHSFDWFISYIGAMIGFIFCVLQGSDDGPITLFLITVLFECFSVKKSSSMTNYFELLFMICLLLLPLRISYPMLNSLNNFPTPFYEWICRTLVFLMITIFFLLSKNPKTKSQMKKFFPFFGISSLLL